MSELTEILAHYGEYRRQYVGLVIRGKRHLYLNSFPADKPELDYTKQLIDVSDGGFWYWQILFRIDDERFHEITVNGEG